MKKLKFGKVYLLGRGDQVSRYKAMVILGANLPYSKWEAAKPQHGRKASRGYLTDWDRAQKKSSAKGEKGGGRLLFSLKVIQMMED